MCHVPNGWGKHQPDLMKTVAYAGIKLDSRGMPIHGETYTVRGFDYSCDSPAIYLKEVVGGIRADKTEMSFSAKGFVSRRNK